MARPALDTAVPAPAPVRAKRLPAQTRRSQLLDVLHDVLVREGDRRFTMEGLAARAGVNKALLYHYFGGRDGMLVALYERTWATFEEAIVAAVDAGHDLESRLRGFVSVWLDQSDLNETFTALFGAERSSDALEQAERSHAVTSVEYLAQVLSIDDDLDPIEARLAAATLLTGGHYGFELTYQFFGLTREAATETFVRFALGLISEVRRSGRAPSR